MSLARALADALLPGGPLPNGVVAPPAGSVLDAAVLEGWHAAHPVPLDGDAFLAAGEEARAEILRGLERAEPTRFGAMVAALIALATAHPAMLEAFGWRAAPPQPEGHMVPAGDLAALERVRARGPIWRPAP